MLTNSVYDLTLWLISDLDNSVYDLTLWVISDLDNSVYDLTLWLTDLDMILHLLTLPGSNRRQI
jgi:hypothetical protein